MNKNYMVVGHMLSLDKHNCTVSGSAVAGLRLLRRQIMENGTATYYNDTLQQATICIECGKTHWTDVPIVEEENEE